MLDFFSVSHQATVIIIVIISALQLYAFFSTLYKINTFKRIFPSKEGAFHIKEGQIDSTITTRKESILSTIIDSINRYLIKNSKGVKESILSTIIDSINRYLIKNSKGVSDFHLMKDIVDRNCDSLEEEVHAQLPTPIYLGLAGTMIGILVGVILLVKTGGLSDLFTTTSNSLGENLGEKGIEALLGGVALAMISSILGIFLTIINSYLIKNAKTKVEKNKNIFLSWIQAELLPSLTNDITGALVRMSENLNSFNRTFEDNTREFKETLIETKNLNDSQAQLYKNISELKIKDIATANIEVYEKLKNTTDEIGLLGDYLKNVRNYSKELQGIIPSIQNYFKEELSQIEQRKAYIAEAIGKVDDYLQQSIQKLKDSAEKQLEEYKTALGTADSIFLDALTKLEEHVEGQFTQLTEATNTQQEIFIESSLAIEKALLEKLQETSSLVEELKNLTEIKKAVANFEKIIEKQNNKIDDLTKSINELAKIKTSGEIKVILETPKIPKWFKISAITVGSLISVTCLAVLIPILIEWIKTLINWLF